MKKVSLVMGMALTAMCLGNEARAEEPEKSVTLEIGADVVSSYVWRGMDCAGFSIQPGATITWQKAGISLGAWASVELMDGHEWANMSEFDLELAWNIEGLTLGLTDYNFCSGKYWSGWRWNASGTHFLEANIAYDFGPLALAWNTLLAGPDHTFNEEGKPEDRCYSTYVELSAPWKLGGLEGSAAVGASLWDDTFSAPGNEGFNVCNIALTATKEVAGIPLSASVITNPQSDRTFFVLGISF